MSSGCDVYGCMMSRLKGRVPGNDFTEMKRKAVWGGAVMGWVGLLWGGWGCCGVGGAGRSGALQTSGESTLKFLQKAIYLNKTLLFRTT